MATPPDCTRVLVDDTPTMPLLDLRYQLGEVIGHGGMGAVHRGHDFRLNRPVAIKLLSERGGPGEQQFQCEVALLAGFIHPNLVRVLDAGELNGVRYVVMDLIEGHTLAERLHEGPLSSEEARRVAVGIGSALSYVHRRGVVHRDVKPANVLLDEHGNCYLADFGIARLVDSSAETSSGIAWGTPAYLAPEQVEGAVVGPKADVYALGLLLLEALTGARAFSGTSAEVMALRLEREPNIPSSVPVRWRSVLTAMTRRRPEDRLSADEVVARLSGVPSGERTVPLRAMAEPLAAAGALAGAAAAAIRERPKIDVIGSTLGPSVPYVRIGREDIGPRGPRVVAAGVTAGVAATVVALSLSGIFSGTATGQPSRAHSQPAPPGVHATIRTASRSSGSGLVTVSRSPVATAAARLMRVIDTDAARGEVTSAAARRLTVLLQPLFAVGPSASHAADLRAFHRFMRNVDRALANGEIGTSAVVGIERATAVLAETLRTGMPVLVVAPAPSTTVAPAAQLTNSTHRQESVTPTTPVRSSGAGSGGHRERNGPRPVPPTKTSPGASPGHSLTPGGPLAAAPKPTKSSPRPGAGGPLAAASKPAKSLPAPGPSGPSRTMASPPVPARKPAPSSPPPAPGPKAAKPRLGQMPAQPPRIL